MTPIQILGLCGLTSSALVAVGGFIGIPALIGIAGVVMLVGNAYALVQK